MFTLAQIDAIHDRFGGADTLAEYLRALGEIGVDRYDSFLSDGHSEYVDDAGNRLVSAATHDEVAVAPTPDQARFLTCLERSERGELTYLEMSRELADSGVARWQFTTSDPSMTYYDRSGAAMLVEWIV